MLPPGFEPKAKLQAWYVASPSLNRCYLCFTAEESSLRIVTLHAMRASDALTPEQLRQLSFDLETGYSEFQAVLAGRK